MNYTRYILNCINSNFKKNWGKEVQEDFKKKVGKVRGTVYHLSRYKNRACHFSPIKALALDIL